MDYELAKQLKDAGFPQQKKDGKIYCPHNVPNMIKATDMFEHIESCPDLVYIPTLSELIEACGNEFIYLMKDHNRWDAKSKTQIISKLSCPEEAVANLWLKLNKK